MSIIPMFKYWDVKIFKFAQYFCIIITYVQKVMKNDAKIDDFGITLCS